MSILILLPRLLFTPVLHQFVARKKGFSSIHLKFQDCFYELHWNGTQRYRIWEEWVNQGEGRATFDHRGDMGIESNVVNNFVAEKWCIADDISSLWATKKIQLQLSMALPLSISLAVPSRSAFYFTSWTIWFLENVNLQLQGETIPFQFLVSRDKNCHTSLLYYSWTFIVKLMCKCLLLV